MSYQTKSLGFGGAITPMVKRLIIANAVMFVVTLLLGRGFVYDWFAFQPREIFFRPWGAFTYMFVHGGLMHVAMNMLMLFFFGSPLEGRWGSQEFLKYYLICGMGGVAMSLLFMPANVVGASAAVYGVMLAFAFNWPEAPIYVFGIFPVKAKWLLSFFFLLSFLSAFDGSGGGVAHFAHLGGLVTGLIYPKSDWRVAKRFQDLRKTTRRRRMAIVPRDLDEDRKEEGRPTPARDQREDAALYDAVDEVLDKISAQGMSSLTSEERKLLDEMSRRHRSN
jgi:membrane associated rhomboid family serine protease